MAEKENFTEKRSTRRNFLKNSGLTLGGLVLGGAVTSLVVKIMMVLRQQNMKHPIVAGQQRTIITH